MSQTLEFRLSGALDITGFVNFLWDKILTQRSESIKILHVPQLLFCLLRNQCAYIGLRGVQLEVAGRGVRDRKGLRKRFYCSSQRTPARKSSLPEKTLSTVFNLTLPVIVAGLGNLILETQDLYRKS